jgi:hypothetical protein
MKRAAFLLALLMAAGDAGAQDPVHPVEIINLSPRPIARVFLSPANAADWGTNQLPVPALPTGAHGRFLWPGPCVSDLRIVFDNRSAEERRDVDLCHGALVISPGWTLRAPGDDKAI